MRDIFRSGRDAVSWDCVIASGTAPRLDRSPERGALESSREDCLRTSYERETSPLQCSGDPLQGGAKEGALLNLCASRFSVRNDPPDGLAIGKEEDTQEIAGQITKRISHFDQQRGHLKLF
jgi:hypothetical protein